MLTGSLSLLDAPFASSPAVRVVCPGGTHYGTTEPASSLIPEEDDQAASIPGRPSRRSLTNGRPGLRPVETEFRGLELGEEIRRTEGN
jgi:hypothetical protein